MLSDGAMTTVLKIGGELLEGATAFRAAADAIVLLAGRGPLVVVHGGGRAIDAELRTRGLTPQFADGLRITDGPTLDAVVSVLAGRNNTALVASVIAAGGRAVGLTGADGAIGLCRRAPAVRMQAGGLVDLGLVGEPVPGRAALLRDLLQLEWVPIVASVGIDADGALLNVNADVLAASLAVALEARCLMVVGTTPGVLDVDGRTIPVLSTDEIDGMAASGAAHSGMIAKLTACRAALAGGVPDVWIVNGWNVADFSPFEGTRLTAARAYTTGTEEMTA
jgi:acetylglutamate kinase